MKRAREEGLEADAAGAKLLSATGGSSGGGCYTAQQEETLETIEREIIEIDSSSDSDCDSVEEEEKDQERQQEEWAEEMIVPEPTSKEGQLVLPVKSGDGGGRSASHVAHASAHDHSAAAICFPPAPPLSPPSTASGTTTTSGSASAAPAGGASYGASAGASSGAPAAAPSGASSSPFGGNECCVCFDTGELIVCEGCQIAVHASCIKLGKRRIPKGDWFCDTCWVNCTCSEMDCVLCPFKGRTAMRRAIGGTSNVKGQWAHILCARALGKIDVNKKTINVKERKCHMYQVTEVLATCPVCGINKGNNYLLKCAIETCEAKVHPWCMATCPQFGFGFSVREQDFYALCPQHAETHDVSPPLNRAIINVQGEATSEKNEAYFLKKIANLLEALRTQATLNQPIDGSTVQNALYQMSNFIFRAHGLRMADTLRHMLELVVDLAGEWDFAIEDLYAHLEHAYTKITCKLIKINVAGLVKSNGLSTDEEVKFRIVARHMQSLRTILAYMMRKAGPDVRQQLLAGQSRSLFIKDSGCGLCAKRKDGKMHVTCWLCGIQMHSTCYTAKVAKSFQLFEGHMSCKICSSSSDLRQAVIDKDTKTVHQKMIEGVHADPAWQPLGSSEPTALHFAAKRNDYDALSLMLHHTRLGGRISAISMPVDSECRSPYDYAASHGAVECMQLLSTTFMGIDHHFTLNFFLKCAGEQTQGRDISFGREKTPISWENTVNDEPFPSHMFTYVKRAFEGPDTWYDWGLTTRNDKKHGCKCRDRHTTCDAFSNRGVSSCHDVVNRVRVECSFLCSCEGTIKSCPNTVTQRGIECKLKVFRTQDRGWGIMAGEDIPAHTFLCTYAGEIITSKEYSDREHIMQKSNKKFPFYVYEINNEDLVIDATRFRGVGAYFNHTCSGHNAEVIALTGAGKDYSRPTYAVFTRRSIAEGEELLINYGKSGKPSPCLCSACKKGGRKRGKA